MGERWRAFKELNLGIAGSWLLGHAWMAFLVGHFCEDTKYLR